MKIPRRIAQTLINSLKGGVVPRVGLQYVTVGRTQEIDALLRDVEIITDGGASFRFIVGKYGSGKSFLLQTIRNYVMAKNFVVLDADLSPERRLQGTRGQGLATYKELVRNMSTKTKPEGGALSLILDRWISNVQQEVMNGAQLSNRRDIDMKRLLYFLPTILVLGFLAFIFFGLGEPSTDPQEYLVGAGILFVFLISDFLLFRKLWFGCIPGALLGAYVIYYGSQYHGQVMDERPVGAIIFAYYAIIGIITFYRKKKASK